MCSMKIAIYILSFSAACVGCSRSPDSTRVDSTPVHTTLAPSTATTQATLPAMNATLDTPDPRWREIFLENVIALSNVPEISVKSTDGKLIRVTAKNVGTTTLQYCSQGAENVQLFQEIKDAGRWTKSNWDWCGTGKELFEIAPNESAELMVDFWDNGKPERMLTNFSEKDTNRSGLVVLAIEPDK